jgi:hypothetical protein
MVVQVGQSETRSESGLCSLAGIEKLRYHDLRHGAISRNIPAVGILENNIHGRNVF